MGLVGGQLGEGIGWCTVPLRPAVWVVCVWVCAFWCREIGCINRMDSSLYSIGGGGGDTSQPMLVWCSGHLSIRLVPCLRRSMSSVRSIQSSTYIQVFGAELPSWLLRTPTHGPVRERQKLMGHVLTGVNPWWFRIGVQSTYSVCSTPFHVHVNFFFQLLFLHIHPYVYFVSTLVHSIPEWWYSIVGSF